MRHFQSARHTASSPSIPALKRGIGGIAFLGLVLAGCCSAQTYSKPNSFVSESQISVGVSAVSIRDKRVVMAIDGHKLFTPSSTAKVLTLAAALRYLGPHYRYDTGVYTREREGSTLKDLILKASGDPAFASTDLAKLVTELKQLGINSVKGDIIIDTSVFDEVAYGKGWMLDDMNEGYSAPVSGISIDDNRIVFGLIPGSSANDPVGITLFPQTNYFTLANKAVTTAKGPQKIKLKLDGKQGITKAAAVTVEAQMHASSATKYDSLAISNPVEFAGSLLAQELKKNGIVFKGKILNAKMPQKTKLLTHHISPPLSEMAIDFMKMSNNHAAEMLLKSIAVAKFGEPGTFDNGLQALRVFLKEDVKTTLGDLVCADGSGLSRYNQISATHFTDLLAYMWQDFRTGPEFVASLALFGEDGTLKSSKNETLLGKVRAKTGSMTNLKSLAGYLKRDDGDVIAFAILTHGGSTAKQQQIIEDILSSLNKS